MALKNFAGAVAVITGGASGIGLATAHALYARGAHVVLADINEQGLQQAQQAIYTSAKQNGQVLTVVTDITNEQQVEALMQQALTINQHIDIVITCAGVGWGGPIDEFTGERMQSMMNINFMGTYYCVRAALPTMRQQGSGHFVFLSSVAGKLAAPMLTGYCATKWAIRGFASALRSELEGSGISATTVYPAWVETPMIQQEAEAMRLLNVVAMLTPQQVAEEILQATANGTRDLTLAPNPDIALIIQIMKDDPDKAEQLSGRAFQQRLQEAQQTSKQ